MSEGTLEDANKFLIYQPEATIRNFRIVQREGDRDVERNIDNLDMILAVGYWGTPFCRWTMERLRGYLVKGFVMADERHQPMTMRDWREKLDAFLQFNQREVLRDAGTVSSEVAKALAEAEYEEFRMARLAQEAQQPDEFDRMAKQLMARNEGQA